MHLKVVQYILNYLDWKLNEINISNHIFWIYILIGDAASAGSGIVVFPDDKRIVIVQKLTLLVDGRPDLELDLTQDLAEVKKKVNLNSKNCTYYLHQVPGPSLEIPQLF